jgi:transmembrane sensor
MNDVSTPANVPPAATRAEAAAWVARLHGSNRSREVTAGVQRWLAASPENARAFAIATEAWNLGGSVAATSLPRMQRIRRPVPWRMGMGAIAAALALLVTGAILYSRTPVVTTEIGEQRIVSLEDGTRVFLNTDTRLIVDYSQAVRNVRLTEGEALFEVARQPARPFVVRAGEQQITAVGTAFVVRNDPAEVSVTIVEGKVEVASVESPSNAHTLTPGQRLTLAATGAARIDTPELEEATAWQRGEVVMDDMRLADAIGEMNRYSLVKLAVQNPSAADVRVSGVFRVGDSARFARAVAETYRLQIVDRPRLIVLTGDPARPAALAK